MNSHRTIFSALAILASASTARSQTTFLEIEPNSSKADATVVSCMAAGDIIRGTSTGAVTGTGLSGLDTTDYYKVTTCVLPQNVYHHTLTLTTSTPGHTGSMRGLSQSGTIGVGGSANLGTDVAIQTLTGTQQHWYGFGKGETIVTRVTGTPSTTGTYDHTLSTAVVPVTVIGPFAPGPITITTEGQGHATDTEVWLYDAGLNAIPLAGNDDTYPPNGGNESTLTRTLAAGTYYLALGTYNFKNDQPAAYDDNYVAAPLMEFPNAAAEDSAASLGDVSFAVTDSVGTTPVPATKVVWYEVLWFRFDVGSGLPGSGNCEPGVGGVMACPCANPNGPGVGCANTGSSGAMLSASGVASLSADAVDPGSIVLTGTNMLSGSSCVFLQGNSIIAGGTGFGAGVRCAGGSLKRIYVKSLVGAGGTKSAPGAADRSVSNRSMDLGDTILSGTTRYYQTYYRDPLLPNPGGSCPGIATFNVSSGWQLTWAP